MDLIKLIIEWSNRSLRLVPFALSFRMINMDLRPSDYIEAMLELVLSTANKKNHHSKPKHWKQRFTFLPIAGSVAATFSELSLESASPWLCRQFTKPELMVAPQASVPSRAETQQVSNSTEQQPL